MRLHTQVCDTQSGAARVAILPYVAVSATTVDSRLSLPTQKARFTHCCVRLQTSFAVEVRATFITTATVLTPVVKRTSY